MGPNNTPITLPIPATALFCGNINDIPTQPIRRNKKRVPLTLLYDRLDKRPVKALLFANQPDCWGDTEIKLENDNICGMEHKIATIRKTNRNMKSENSKPTEPGLEIGMDVIHNTANVNLTPETSFQSYLFLVDFASRTPHAIGLPANSTISVIRAIKHYRAQCLPHDCIMELALVGSIQSDAGTQFTSTEFLEECNQEDITLMLAAPKHQ